MGVEAEAEAGGGTAEQVVLARASIDPVAQASRASILKPKQLTGDEQQDSKVQRTMHVIDSEAFKQSGVSDMHILLNSGSGSHFSWVVCHSPTRTHVLALKKVYNAALEDDRKPELLSEVKRMQDDGYTFATITLEESKEKDIAQRSISNVQLIPLIDFDNVKEKIDGLVYCLCPAENCTTSVTPQSAKGRYCSKHQDGIDESKEEEYKRRVLESGKVDGKYILFSPDMYKARTTDFDWANYHNVTREKINYIVNAYNSAEIGTKPQTTKACIVNLLQ